MAGLGGPAQFHKEPLQSHVSGDTGLPRRVRIERAKSSQLPTEHKEPLQGQVSPLRHVRMGQSARSMQLPTEQNYEYPLQGQVSADTGDVMLKRIQRRMHARAQLSPYVQELMEDVGTTAQTETHITSDDSTGQREDSRSRCLIL